MHVSTAATDIDCYQLKKKWLPTDFPSFLSIYLRFSQFDSASGYGMWMGVVMSQHFLRSDIVFDTIAFASKTHIE